MRAIHFKHLRVAAIVAALIGSLLNAPSAQALFKVVPDTKWSYLYAGEKRITPPDTRAESSNATSQSTFDVKYNNFPDWAKNEVQAAIDIWSANFRSSVPIHVEATWGRASSYGILGSASSVNFYSGFAGAPDPSLWYTSALANALSGKDLDKTKPEIIIQVNSGAKWNTRGDGSPTSNEYDLESVFLHEIAHGLGFASNDEYVVTRDTTGKFIAVGNLEQPTPYDAYAQTFDGRRLVDIPTPSTELAAVLTSSLYWSGPLAIKVNDGVKPKLYTPSRYESGSSISHLDEAIFSMTGLNSVMTPSLDPGEIFREPGPLLLAMMEDMRNKPPVGLAITLPDSPRNAQALIADSAALITFDPPINLRTAQITEYVVKNLKTGVEKKSSSSPVVMPGLKNGLTYSFSIIARNSLGDSSPAITATMAPQMSWKSTVLDPAADGKSIVSAVFNGQPAIAYTDSKSGDLKLATFDGKVWKKTTIDGANDVGGRTKNPITGPISMCVNGSGVKQTLHIFYSDTISKDLRYAKFYNQSLSFEIVDGNGLTINEYADPVRVRSSSDVSVANACVATTNTIQVFYRDESQGILLGAVKAKKGPWSYELIDGDRASNGRATGDVGFHLAALFDGSQTVVMYDSVISLNQKGDVTAGAVRVASRAGVDAAGWSYQILDIPSDNASIFGFDVGLTKVGNDVMATWLATSLVAFPKPDQLRWAMLSAPTKISSLTTKAFGEPNSHLVLDSKLVIFSCQDRICLVDTSKKEVQPDLIRLIRASQDSEATQSAWVLINKIKYLVASVNGKLSLLRP